MSLLTDSHRILWNGALSVVVPTFLIALVKILFMSLKKKKQSVHENVSGREKKKL